jgi:putative Holliday junction resolvase
MATPYEVIARSGDPSRDHRAIAEMAADCGAELLVVGLPLSLDGTDGPAAIAARAEAEELANATGLPVELWDERLTTVTAHRDLQSLDLDGKRRRRVVDQVAAAVMLQAWLDHRRLATAREEPDR